MEVFVASLVVIIHNLLMYLLYHRVTTKKIEERSMNINQCNSDIGILIQHVCILEDKVQELEERLNEKENNHE